MKLISIITSVLSIVLIGIARGQDSSGSLKQRFLKEYPGAIKAWESRFGRSVVRYKYMQDDVSRKDSPHHETIVSFKCQLPDKAIMTQEARGSGGRPEQSVSGFNDRYAFALKKGEDSRDFSIQSLEMIKGSQAPRGKSSVTNSILQVFWLPYEIPFKTDGMVSNPRFVVRAVSPVSRDGKNLLKVEFDWPSHPAPKPSTKKFRESGGHEGFLLVSPDENWVLYEFECRERKGNPRFVWKGTVDYQGALNGFLIPKRAARQQLKLPGGELVSSHSFELLEFRFADVPDSDFTLAAFGLSEQVVQPARVARYHRLGYWFLAFALAALVIAVGLKVASSRLQKVRAS